jgi:hypothetical protein
MNFWILQIICVALQFVFFIPFYCVWRKDCEEIGKDNLAVSLSERFFVWLIYFPVWIVPIVCVLKGR